MAYQSSIEKLGQWDKELKSKPTTYQSSLAKLDQWDKEIAEKENAPPKTWSQSLEDAGQYVGSGIAQAPIEMVKGVASLPQLLSAGLIKNPFSENYKIPGAGENYLAKMGLMNAKVPGYEGGPYQEAIAQGFGSVMPGGPLATELEKASVPLVSKALGATRAKILSPLRRLSDLLNGKEEKSLLEGIN